MLTVFVDLAGRVIMRQGESPDPADVDPGAELARIIIDSQRSQIEALLARRGGCQNVAKA